VINDHTGDDIRALFDWRSASADDGQRRDRMHSLVANDDLALALQLLSCNQRDRQQFSGARGGAAAMA